MAQNKEKIVQALVEAIRNVAEIVVQADTLAQNYKTKFQTLNPDLTGTNLTSAQISAVNSWISDLNTLRNSPIVTAVQNKTVPSHGIGALS